VDAAVLALFTPCASANGSSKKSPGASLPTSPGLSQEDRS